MEDNIMRPTIGSSQLAIPVTFDYSGGRREKNKSRRLWSIVVMILGLIFGIGLIFNKKGFFLTNAIFGLGAIWGAILIIRFVILKEKLISKIYSDLKKSDYKKKFDEIWGIYSIDDVYPYYCRFRNGRSGVYVKLNKDVILGKYSDSEFAHYEAISDAYNIVGSESISMCHIDYMDVVGSDSRLEESFISLSEVSNTDVKDVLTDYYSYLQAQMDERLTTQDVYLFTWRGSDINAWKSLQDILSCLMDANFVNYHIMDSGDIRDLTKRLFNLKDFSVFGATSSLLSSLSHALIRPIKITSSDGKVKVLGKTMEEKKAERVLAEKEKDLRSKEVKNRKKKKKDTKEESIDLF